MSGTRYVIGIDVGERSVGCAAIEFDDDDFAAKALSLVSVIHDGGEDPSSGQSKVSRLAAAGVARRTRRLHERRRTRLEALSRLLESHGLGTAPAQSTYEAWLARDELSRGFVTDDDRRNRLIGLVVMHMAHHRGWRNSWHSDDRLAATDFPSENGQKLMSRAEEWCDVEAGTFSTVGQAVAGVITAFGKRATVRPRGGDIDPLMAEQVRASDQLAELRLILSTQRVPDDVAEQLWRAVFHVERPHVPKERVGTDVMPGMSGHRRAGRASLEFQEFRVRAFVANLRIKTFPGKRVLTETEYDSVVEALLGWDDDAPPKIGDIADLLGVKPSAINRDRIDQESVAVPVDRSTAAVEKVLRKRHPLRVWWDAASPQQRCEWVTAVSDVTDARDIDDDLIAEPLAILADDDDAAALVEKLGEAFQSGRTAYSRASLTMLLDTMRATRCDEYTARVEVFDLDEDWSEPTPTLDDPIEHPALQRINTIVRRFISACEQRWGQPERVVVEHVRGSFLGPAALQEYRNEIKGNQTRNTKRRAELLAQGIERASMRDIRRNLALQRQNSACLYCGITITMATSEMDHIVADSLGGANTRDNLVAVCRDCNHRKGKRSFIEYATTTSSPDITLEAAQGRVRAWQRIDETGAQLRRLKRDVSRRLALSAADVEGTDERSMETTAYAAVEMRRRIAGSLNLPLTAVPVYRGAITREARRAGGVDAMLRVRGALDKNRFDRRHHAIDAAVLTTLTPLTARTLAERAALHTAESIGSVDQSTWRDYQGATANAVDDFVLWKQRIGSVADSIKRELDADRIAVSRPLRLTPRSSRAHLDGIHPLVTRDVTDSWMAADIDRITDPATYAAMLTLLGAATSLPAAPDRAEVIAGQLAKAPEPLVTLFPGKGAQTLIRGGAADLGEVHHGRIYAWKTKAGFGFGWIRVFAGELSPLGLAAGDILTADLPDDSASMRTANRALRDRITKGEAVRIGWVSARDEIELNPHAPGLSEGQLRHFIANLPEKRWIITGFYNNTTVSITPALLAAEGLPDVYKPMPDEEDTRTDEQRAVATILAENRIRIAVNGLLQDPSLMIVRRTALGRPRWKSDVLPTTWSPWRAARNALGS